MIPHVGLLLWTEEAGGFMPPVVAATPFYGYFPPTVRIVKDNRIQLDKDNRVSLHKDNRVRVNI